MTCPALLLGVALLAAPAAAQRADSARVTVDVRADARPLAGAQLRAGRVGALTGDDGRATLRLPAGPATVVVLRLGYQPDTLQLVLRAGADTLVTVSLRERPAEVEEVIVTAARTARRLEDEPERVEVIAGPDIFEKTQIRPGDLTQLLTEMSGVRVQSTSPALGGATVRIQGLRGQYTQTLVDGLPLYGAQPGGLALLQAAPLDVKQVEVIKGAATALYGPSALGGVMNIVSRRPEGVQEVVATQSSLRGTDVIAWLSDTLPHGLPGARDGWTLTAGAHQQDTVDVDRDGWADLPGFVRAELRPRLFLTSDAGSSLLATVGVMTEQRAGGTMRGAVTPGGTSFPLCVRSVRVDGGVAGHLTSGRGAVGTRLALSEQWHRRRFGPAIEDDRQETALAEATYGEPLGTGAFAGGDWLAGVAVQHDALRAPDTPAQEFSFDVPGVFAQVTTPLGRRLTTTATGRCDRHSRYGTFCAPRLSALVRLTPAWTTRLSAGAGAYGPTPFTDETEQVGLGRLRPFGGLRREQVRSASVDVTGSHRLVQLNATLYASELRDPVQARALPGDSLALENAPGPTRTVGGEAFALIGRDPMVLTLFYARVRSTELDLDTGRRRDVPLLPRETALVDLAWDAVEETGTFFAFEAAYVGRQAVEDDPYASTGRPFATIEILLSQRVGPVNLFVNGENLLDVRQTRWQPLVRPTPGRGGRWTTDEWAPLEGRVLTLGARLRLGAPRR